MLDLHGEGDELSWRTDALCREGDPEWWYYEDGNEDLAFRFCALCPVTDDCLEYALKHEARIPPGYNRHGIWGGLGPAARTRLHNLRERAKRRAS